MRMFFVTLAMVLFMPVATFAADTQTTPPAKKNCGTGGQYRECITLYNPLNPNAKPDDPENVKREKVQYIIGIVINAAMGIIGSVALLMLVYGGFKWLTSAGNSDKVQEGTQTMIWAVVGLVITLSSYITLTTVTSYLTGTVDGGGAIQAPPATNAAATGCLCEIEVSNSTNQACVNGHWPEKVTLQQTDTVYGVLHKASSGYCVPRSQPEGLKKIDVNLQQKTCGSMSGTDSGSTSVSGEAHFDYQITCQQI